MIDEILTRLKLAIDQGSNRIRLQWPNSKSCELSTLKPLKNINSLNSKRSRATGNC